MTIEELKAIAAGLYKDAEEATPIIGDGDKNEWMANRLDEIVDENYPSLDCLMDFSTSSEVTDFLEKEYDQRNKDVADREIPCDHQRSVNRHDQRTMGNQRYTETPDVILTEHPDVIIEEEIFIVENDMDRRPDRTNRPDSDCGC